ncbi:hypothetical protein BESB_074130 [Besnoitia besnoiti]|uniref:Nop14-like family protein n=1 Tax=Besnoitia besnoiti TaxID=94643 RepID=A0A2A9MD90_BESBE|nr:uncharacterized protein BESB_074130 [Besnoitia besnoiti]PFH34261.1 hypothetical protein BESB_074130 [Besnoitia besnoiti]
MAKKRKEGGVGGKAGKTASRGAGNAFEVLANKKLRRAVVGLTVKGSSRNSLAATHKDQQRRSHAFHSASSVAGFRDERFSGGGKGDEEDLLFHRMKLLAQRRQREKELARKCRNKKKKGGFALGEEDDEEDEGLTVSGKALSQMEDDELKKLGTLGERLGDDIEDEGVEFPSNLFFKDGYDAGEQEGDTKRPLTRREIYREIIANSKEAKARLASEQRQQQMLLEKLDDDYADLLKRPEALFRPTKKQAMEALLQKHLGKKDDGAKKDDAQAAAKEKHATKSEAPSAKAPHEQPSAACPLLLFSSSSSSASSVSASSASSVSASSASSVFASSAMATSSLTRQQRAADDFDALAASLRFDRRLPGTEKLLTAEELAEKKKKMLEKKERERTERMLQLGDEPEEEGEDAEAESEEDEEGDNDAEDREEDGDKEEKGDDDDEEKDDEDEDEEDDEEDDDDDDESEEDEEVEEARTLLEEGAESDDEDEEEIAEGDDDAGDKGAAQAKLGRSLFTAGTAEPSSASGEDENGNDTEDESEEDSEGDEAEEEESNGNADGKDPEAAPAGENDDDDDEAFLNEDEKKARVWMRNDKGEETLTFKPPVPLTRDDARALLLPHPLRSQWKLLHRVRVLHFGEDAKAASSAIQTQKEKKEKMFRALLGYALDAHLASLRSDKGFPLSELWAALSEHYLFFAEEFPDVVFSFFFPLLVNMSARVSPEALPPELFSLLSSAFSPLEGTSQRGAVGEESEADSDAGKKSGKKGKKSKNGAEAAKAGLPRDTLHAFSVASSDESSLPYPLLSAGAPVKKPSSSATVPPAAADLAVLHFLFLACPLTDFRHPLLSPALLLLDFFASMRSSFSLSQGAAARPSAERRALPPALPASEAALTAAVSAAEHMLKNVEQSGKQAPQRKETRSAARGETEQEAQGAESGLPPAVAASSIDTSLQILLLQRIAMRASGRFFPSFFSLAIALLRTLLQSAEGGKANAQESQEIAKAVLNTLRAQVHQMAEASQAAYVPLAHYLLPAFPALHAALLLAAARSAPAKVEKRAEKRQEAAEGDEGADCLARLTQAPWFPLLVALRRLWRACEAILVAPLEPLSLYHAGEKVGLTLLTPRYVEPSLLRRRGSAWALEDETRVGFEELRREKRQANQMRRQGGRMLRRDAAFVMTQKGRRESFRKRRNADRQKEIMGILEQDQVEYKKLKTTGENEAKKGGEAKLGTVEAAGLPLRRG